MGNNWWSSIAALHNASPAAIELSPGTTNSPFHTLITFVVVQALFTLMRLIYNRLPRHMTRITKTGNVNGIPQKPSMIQPHGKPLSITLADIKLPSGFASSHNNLSYVTAIDWPGTSFGPNDLQDIIKDFSSRDDVWNPLFLDCMIETALKA